MEAKKQTDVVSGSFIPRCIQQNDPRKQTKRPQFNYGQKSFESIIFQISTTHAPVNSVPGQGGPLEGLRLRVYIAMLVSHTGEL